MHVVDLDGAKDGSPKNRAVIRELCKLPLEIEVGRRHPRTRRRSRTICPWALSA